MTQTKAELLQTRHQGDIRLGDADSTHYVGFKAPATVGTSLVWTLPAADGTANYLLKTDGSGNLGWVADSSTDSTKMPLSGGTFTGDVTFDGATAGRDIVFDRSDNALEFADSAKAIFGTGSDLEIYHSGAHSYLRDVGTGSLRVNASQFHVLNAGDTEFMAKFIEDGAVELYHNNVKKAETGSGGLTVQGQVSVVGSGVSLSIADSGKAAFGNGDDLKIYFDGSHSYIKQTSGRVRFETDGIGYSFFKGAGSEYLATFEVDGACNLYYDNSKKFETWSGGAQCHGSFHTDELVLQDNEKIKVGTGADLQLWHDSSNSYITNTTGVINIQAKQTENSIVLNPDGAVELYYDNSKKLTTHSSGAIVHGTEGGDANLFFYADEGDDNADKWLIQSESDGFFALKNYASGSWEISLKATGNGAVELNYDDVKKFETTSAGSKFTGGIAQVVTAAGALDLDLNTSNYFTKTISGNSTFTFSNPAASGQVTAFTLELTHSSGTVTWPSSVKWNADTAPTLTTGKTHLFMFVTDDGGTRYRGSALVDYVN